MSQESLESELVELGGFISSSSHLCFAMFTGSHILLTSSSFCFLKLARGPDLPIVIFSLLVVIFGISPLGGLLLVVLIFSTGSY